MIGAGYVRGPRTIPVVADERNLTTFLANWQNTIKQVIRTVTPPPCPQNFRALGVRGAIRLTWSPVNPGITRGQLGQGGIGADGYEILRSLSGDFTSDLVVIPLRDVNQTQYDDPVGGAATTASYRIHATAGTPRQSHAVAGPDSGTVRTTSIDATDTTTVGTMVHDKFTTDTTRATARIGRYKVTV